MNTTRNRVQARLGAKTWAQSVVGGPAIVVENAGDETWNEAIDAACVQMSRDRPNLRVVHATVVTSGFRQILAGTGALAALTGADAWDPAYSYFANVYFPYAPASQGVVGLDPNEYRIGRDPGGVTFVEFGSVVPQTGDTIRLEFYGPHIVHETDQTQTTVLAGDWTAFRVLCGFFALTIAAARAVQNTGNTGLPTDIVDRRTQSDIFKSRAKDLWNIYASMVGIGPAVESAGGGGQPAIAAASGFKDLDVVAGTPVGFLWHSSRNR